MITLYPYQNEGVQLIRANFAKGHKRVLFCLPTGGGKTVVFSYLVWATLQKNPKARVLILTDREELLKQSGGTLSKFGLTWFPISAKEKLNPFANVYVGMVETFYNRAKKYHHLLDMDLVIIDEAHRGNFKKLFPLFKERTYVIGPTATPISANQKDPLNKYYQSIVCTVTTQQLIDRCALVPAVTISAKIDTSGLKEERGEYTDESQIQVLGKREVYDGVVSKYKQYGDGKKAIIYNINVEHSLEVTSRFLEEGIEAEHVDGETPDDVRIAIFARYKSGQTKVLCNVGVATTGFDDPSTEVIIINRATTSLTLWLQMCGRGGRLCPEIGKTHFTLIDMANNWKYLGLWADDRDWEAIFYEASAKKKKAKKGVAPVKSCPSCDAIIGISASTCEYCGHEFEKPKPNIVEEVEFGIVDVTPKDWVNLTVEQLVRVQALKKYKLGWILHQLRDRSKMTERRKEIEPLKEKDLKQYESQLSIIRTFEVSTYEKHLVALAEIKGYKKSWVKREIGNYLNREEKQ